MLSYRHGFHAGNYADVLKHIVWQQILKHLNSKDKAYCVIDTHAGAGMFDLRSGDANKTAEYRDGIGKLWDNHANAPLVVDEYLDAIASLNQDSLTQYPGSPWFTASALRHTDRAWMCELHPRDYPLLEQTLRNAHAHPRKVKAFRQDGFETLIAKLPPLERRGAVLIDPSYEIKTDYQTVVDALIAAHKRFASGTYALWYPVVERHRTDVIEKGLIKSGIKNIHCYELALAPDNNDFGMTAAGLYVINPPWTLATQLADVLPWLQDKLAGGQGTFRNEVLVAE